MTSQLLSQNYASSDRNAGITVSSFQTGFAATNLYNFPRRTKVWRSGGHYEIVSGENTIDFKVADAPTVLTATIAAGSYATFVLLAAEIKSKMEAQSSQTHTITQDATTLKTVITSDSAFFEINWTTSQDMAQVLGFSELANDTGATSYTSDELRISTGEFFQFDMGVAVNPDAVVASWRSDKPSAVSDGTVMTVKGNSTNNFSTVEYTGTATKTEFGFLLQKNQTSDGLHSSALRYWRVEFDDLANPNGYIELGSLFLGKWIGFTRGQVQIPFNASWDESTSIEISSGGNAIANNNYLTRSFGASWFALTQIEKEAFDEFYYEHRTSKPFYFLLDPGEVLGSSVERNIVYCRFASTPSWSMERPGIFTLDASFREEL